MAPWRNKDALEGLQRAPSRTWRPVSRSADIALNAFPVRRAPLPHQHLDHRFPAFQRLHRRRAEVPVVILQGDAATKAGGPRDLVVGGAFEQIEFLIPFAHGFLDA